MKILMVGLGGIGQRHLRNLRKLLGKDDVIEAYRVRGLEQTLTDQLEIDPGMKLAAAYGLMTFSDLDAAIASRPDAAFICNPTSLHIPVALALAKAGCHLFLEKPLSHTLEGVEELIQTMARQRLVGLVGYQLRFHPCVRQLRSWIQAGRVGRLLAVNAEVGEYLPGWHPYEDFRQMYAARTDLGGGVILSQIHELDYLGWIFGWPQSVYAVGGHLSGLEIDVEDTASLLMRVVREGRDLPVHLHMDYIQRPPTRTCHVLGDQGKVLMDLRAATLTLLDASGQTVEALAWPQLERNTLFLEQTAHFLQCLQGTTLPLTPLEEGLRSLKVALAAKISMGKGQPIALGEIPA